MTRDEWVARWPRPIRIDFDNRPTDLSPEQQAELDRTLGWLKETWEQNPLQTFWPHTCQQCDTYSGIGFADDPWEKCTDHRTPQLDFFLAQTKLVAAFAGNRFGKTTALIVWLLIQHAPPEILPEHLRPFRVTDPDRGAMGRLLCPSEDALIEYVIPAVKKWCPKILYKGDGWDKAWSKQHSILFFTEGCGQVSVYTYKQDPAVMVGAELDYVAYDEPPPEEHRKECLPRLIDRDGCERYALTPVNMKGGGIGWLHRKIWKRREAPHITVVKGSSYENRTLKKEAIDAALAEFTDEERRAREKGDFVHFGGVVYESGFEDNLCKPPSPERVQEMDVVVGIDPGLVNAAFVWVAFGKDGQCVVFHEELLQRKTPDDYARLIRAVNKHWGLKHPFYVIDPSAKNGSLTNGRNVQQELLDAGIPSVAGQNQREAGVQQIRRRLQHRRMFVSRSCPGLRDEAEEYRIKVRPDGEPVEEFDVVKENDHRLDALRYAVMARPWYPPMDDRPKERLGFIPDWEGPYRPSADPSQEHSPPLGALS